MEKKKSIKRYTLTSIDELGNELRKYIGDRCNSLSILLEKVKNGTDMDKNVFCRAFGKFLEDYFLQFHPIDCKCFDNVTSYYRPIYFHESCKKFEMRVLKYETKEFYSYSMNVFKTFWKESFALKHQRGNCTFIEFKKPKDESSIS